ncbi:MAG: lysine--tRNA ligase [Myxococcales bacterium]|nr:lysine--tRNA ligase [Myxococcales bacterium]
MNEPGSAASPKHEPLENQPNTGAGRGAHAAEQELIEVRKAKAARVRARGENPFANDVAGTSPGRSELPLTALAEVREQFRGARGDDGRYVSERIEAQAFRVAGRILFLRSFGGMTFVRLRDRTGELQLVCEQALLGSAFARLEDLDLGDIVEAWGGGMATKKGELSIGVEGFRLLTKSYRPLPTKTSFTDVEARYRQRYVDLVANPHVAEVFRARSVITGAVRAFLDAQGFLEVETPSMHTLIGGAAARPFVTHHNTLDMQLFMRIAPELYLKRLVVGGFERVYELARCYRNEGVSTRHNPEFTMLEYYEAYATHATLMDKTEALLRHVDETLAARMPGTHALWMKERQFSFESFARIPMKEATSRALAASGLPSSLLDTVEAGDAPIKEWARESKSRGRELDWANFRNGMKKTSNPGERMFCAYEYLAEPFLARDYRVHDKSIPVFITDYPAEISPLARRQDQDASLVDRFELFVHGQELCNAFSELNDPEDQAARFRAQVDAKARGAEETMDFDHDYVRALEHGMPPCAGFGMGMDRLVMMLTATPTIRDVILFPLLRPESG